LFKAKGQEIYDAVMDAKAVQERTVAVASNQSNGADDEIVRPTYTCKEVLQATLIVEEYISELNGPHAWKLELALQTLAKQIRFLDSDMNLLKDTSYFKCR
jgi:hypothetical protein